MSLYVFSKSSMRKVLLHLFISVFLQLSKDYIVQLSCPLVQKRTLQIFTCYTLLPKITITRRGQMLWCLAKPRHTHRWGYLSTGSKPRMQTFTYCIFWLAWLFNWILLTCLHIQSEFSQPKLSSRILHPCGQKYTHGPSMGWFGRGNNVFLVPDLYHP